MRLRKMMGLWPTSPSILANIPTSPPTNFEPTYLSTIDPDFFSLGDRIICRVSNSYKPSRVSLPNLLVR
jgi:hypothetical protein